MSALFDNKKLSSQSHNRRDESYYLTTSSSRGTTLLVFLTISFSIIDEKAHSWRHPTLPRCSSGGKTTFTGYFAAWEPPTWAYLLVQSVCPLQNFLRPAAHEAVLRRRIRSELSPFIGSLSVTHLILCSLNAGQSLYSC